ncbi:MAG: hypothetical protein ABI889_15165, partial [Gemmatimonadota bacterium]
VVTRARLTLSAGAAWLLVEIERDPRLDPIALGVRHRVTPERMREVEAELVRARFIESDSESRSVTKSGCEALGKLVRARRAHIHELVSDWPESQRADTTAVFRRLAEELVPDVRVPASRS